MTYDWHVLLGIPPTASVVATPYTLRGRRWIKVALSDRAWALFLLAVPNPARFDDALRRIPGLTLQGASYEPQPTLYFTVDEEA
jgi:hypothetical protein